MMYDSDRKELINRRFSNGSKNAFAFKDKYKLTFIAI